MKQSSIKVAGLALACGSLLMFSQQSGALEEKIDISASITNNCVATSQDSTGLAYDPVDVNATDPLQDANASLTVTCTMGAAVAIGLDGQNDAENQGSGSGLHAAKNGSHYLEYATYQDSGYTTLWGHNSQTSDRLTTTGTGATDQHIIYIKAPGGQTTLPAGTYSDQLTATITF